MTLTFASITARMRLNFFSHDNTPEPEQSVDQGDTQQASPRPQPNKTFPADEIVWGIAIRSGYDEIDDPGYHRGTTQHAYLEGNDNVAICGFRPPQSGPRTRRRSRLGLPTQGEHPMCGMCARLVVAPRPRAPIPVQSGRPPVAVPVQSGRPPVAVPVQPGAPAGVGPRMSVSPLAAAGPVNGATPPLAAPSAPMSPWVRQRSVIEAPSTISVDLGARHDQGLMERGVHSESKEN